MKNKLPLCDLVQAAKSFTQTVINEALEHTISFGKSSFARG